MCPQPCMPCRLTRNCNISIKQLAFNRLSQTFTRKVIEQISFQQVSLTDAPHCLSQAISNQVFILHLQGLTPPYTPTWCWRTQRWPWELCLSAPSVDAVAYYTIAKSVRVYGLPAL